MAKQTKPGERLPTTFVLSDESVNLYGFRVRTEGIDIERYKLNPVVCYMHDMGVLAVVGRGVNIRKENNQLLCDVEFDYDDPDAARVAGKVERGFVRAASIGFDFRKVATTETADGQTENWVEESELLEWSIVGVGANRYAIRVLQAGEFRDLNAATSAQLSASLVPTPPPARRTGAAPPASTDTQTERKMNEKEMARQLGLPETATSEQIQAAFTAKLNAASQADALQTQLKAERDAKVKGLLDAAIANQSILPGERKDFEDLAEANFTMFEKTLSLRKPVPNLVQVGQNGQKAATTTTTATETTEQLKAEWDKLHRAGGLSELKAKNPARYGQLYAARYGTVKVSAGTKEDAQEAATA